MIESELQDLEENPHDLGKIKKLRLSVAKLEHLYEQSVLMQSASYIYSCVIKASTLP